MEMVSDGRMGIFFFHFVLSPFGNFEISYMNVKFHALSCHVDKPNLLRVDDSNSMAY